MASSQPLSPTRAVEGADFAERLDVEVVAGAEATGTPWRQPSRSSVAFPRACADARSSRTVPADKIAVPGRHNARGAATVVGRPVCGGRRTAQTRSADARPPLAVVRD